MSEHTPAPWKHDDTLLILAENDWRIAKVSGPSPTARRKEWEEDMQTCKANAALISAAPDLLEALEAAEKALTSLPHSWGFEFTDLPKIRAALKKAKP